MRLVMLLLVLSVIAFSQGHSVMLTWQDTENGEGTTYNVYRASGACSNTLTLTKIASAVSQKTYEDLDVVPGVLYCYAVTAVSGDQESAYSDRVPALVPSFTVRLG